MELREGWFHRDFVKVKGMKVFFEAEMGDVVLDQSDYIIGIEEIHDRDRILDLTERIDFEEAYDDEIFSKIEEKLKKIQEEGRNGRDY